MFYNRMHRLPQTYSVGTNGGKPAVVLGAPAMRALGAETGDTVLVTETEDGINVEVLGDE